MVANVEICESNGAGETVTHGVSNINYGDTDAPNIVVADYTVLAGEYSYIKYVRVHVTAMGGSNKIEKIKIWKSAGAYVAGEDIQTNLKTSAYSQATYATPVKTIFSDQTMPVADPGSANLGIAASLTGSLTAAGYSDYWKSQFQTSGSTPPGNVNTKTYTIKYDES
jgi:hypothetical protein